MAFPDPSKPIATCVAPDCAECPVQGKIHCHFRAQDLAHFLIISMPGLVVGGAGVLAFGARHLVFWIAIMVGFFGFVEIRVMCAHCPHYAESGRALGCWANHGALKLWQYRPGPMTVIEKSIFFAGLVVIWGYPLPPLIMEGKWFLLMLYLLTNAGFFMTLKMFLCARCMNFACPLNAVENNARDQFLQRNPSVAKHGGRPH
jgi:hypothetical protein